VRRIQNQRRVTEKSEYCRDKKINHGKTRIKKLHEEHKARKKWNNKEKILRDS
jgi:hypothetical protein